MVGDEYRGRGHSGGGHNRKRRHRDDDSYDRNRQRRRYEEPPSVAIRKQLLTIAESAARRAEDDVAGISKSVAEHYDDETIRSEFQQLVLQLVVEQPLKIPFVAAVVLVTNAQKPELTASILAKAGELVQNYINAGEWRAVKLMLRFLGCMQGLYEGEGIFPILEELFQRAAQLQMASSEDSLGLELVKVILFTLPYVMASSATGLEAQATALLDQTVIIASTPHTLEALVDPFPAEEGDEGKSYNALGLIQNQLQEEAKNSWELTCIPRPWKIPREDENSEDPLKDAQKHSFPTISIPEPVKNGPRALFPEMYMSVYLDQDMVTVPPTSNIASSLIRDALADTINILDYNRIATAKFLIDVDCYFTPDIFVKRATPFDKLRDLNPDRDTWKPEDIVVDAVFAQLFQLPASEHKHVYYHSVLTEACKIAPAAIAPSLGRAIRFMYRNIDRLDLALSYRFLGWFAHHLSNFGFTWKWTEWVEDIDLPNVHPKKAFILGALDKEIRLSFAQRIKGTLPEEYQPLVTEGKEKDTPDFKYDKETTPYAKEGKEIMQLIRKKATDEEIQPVIASIEEQAAGLGVIDPVIQSTDAYMTSICFVGSKSLSHFLSCIERCKDRLLAIGPKSAAARRQIITSVLEYWVDQPGIGVNIVDKLLNYTILTPLSVVEWALVDHLAGGAILSKPHVYEMVSSTMYKVTNRIRQIVAARVQPALIEPQLSVIDETLKTERAGVQEMFRLIEDSLLGVASGSNDVMMERGDDDSNLQSENEIVREWGKRWQRVFRRKSAVEEAFIAEAMTTANAVGTTVSAVPLPPVQEQAPAPAPTEAAGADENANPAAGSNNAGDANANAAPISQEMDVSGGDDIADID